VFIGVHLWQVGFSYDDDSAGCYRDNGGYCGF
jgi:hypothetical protein